MNSERIPLDLIDMGGRLRMVDPDRVLIIMAPAAENGIRQPIEIRPAKAKGRFLLVSGGHRLTVARELGRADIPAIVLPKMSDDEARLLEIDENVYRAELSDLDRAVFLAEKKAIHERLFPHTKHGGDRVSDEAQEQVAIFGHLVNRFTPRSASGSICPNARSAGSSPAPRSPRTFATRSPLRRSPGTALNWTLSPSSRRMFSAPAHEDPANRHPRCGRWGDADGSPGPRHSPDHALGSLASSVFRCHAIQRARDAGNRLAGPRQRHGGRGWCWPPSADGRARLQVLALYRCRVPEHPGGAFREPDGDHGVHGRAASSFDLVQRRRVGSSHFLALSNVAQGTAANKLGGVMNAQSASVRPPYLQGAGISAATDAANRYKMVLGSQLQVVGVNSRTTANGGQRLHINNFAANVAQTGVAATLVRERSVAIPSRPAIPRDGRPSTSMR